MNHLRKPLKKILLPVSLLLLTLLFATNTLAESGELEQDTGPYHVIMQTDPESLVANQAGTVSVIVSNKATGQPVTGAKVIMSKPSMQSSNTHGSGDMAGMTMSSSLDTQGETVMSEDNSMPGMTMDPGSYMVEGITYNEPGIWDQTVTISSTLGEGSVTFSITVGKSGPNLVLIGSVVGVILIAGILAAILKRKKK